MWGVKRSSINSVNLRMRVSRSRDMICSPVQSSTFTKGVRLVASWLVMAADDVLWAIKNGDIDAVQKAVEGVSVLSVCVLVLVASSCGSSPTY